MKKILLIFCVTTLVFSACTSKPSKETVKKSFKESLIAKLGSNPTADQKQAVSTYSDCLVDETYSDLSAKTLQKFIDTKNVTEFEEIEGTKKELEVLDAAKEACSKDLLNANN